LAGLVSREAVFPAAVFNVAGLAVRLSAVSMSRMADTAGATSAAAISAEQCLHLRDIPPTNTTEPRDDRIDTSTAGYVHRLSWNGRDIRIVRGRAGTTVRTGGADPIDPAPAARDAIALCAETYGDDAGITGGTAVGRDPHDAIE
jgi:hypothetical protein